MLGTSARLLRLLSLLQARADWSGPELADRLGLTAGEVDLWLDRLHFDSKEAQQAATIVLEPIFEADFMSCSYGFRPKRSAVMAKERLRRGFIEGYPFVVEFDIANFFGEIDHDHPFIAALPPQETDH